MKESIKYLKELGFKEVPCSIPKNEFQYWKRNFYIFILGNVSEKLFYFLRDKVSPIKFLDERPKGEVVLNIRIDGDLIELFIESPTQKRRGYYVHFYSSGSSKSENFEKMSKSNIIKVLNLDPKLKRLIRKRNINKLKLSE